MNRRDFLGGLGAVGLASFAGCADSVSGATGPPNVPEQRLHEGGWERFAADTQQLFEQSIGPVTVTGTANTVQYEDAALRERLEADTLGSVSSTVALFSATRVVTDPSLGSLPGGVGVSQLLDVVEDRAKSQFRNEMENQGLKNPKAVGEFELEVETGETARGTEFEAEFPVPPMSFDLPNGEQLTIEGAELEIEGQLAVWEHANSVLVAGGAYPGENYTRALQRNVTDAVTVGVDVDLELEPKSYAQEVRSLVTRVE
ncbi:DUF6517 family protein [Halospeciosus flavus]|uniref:DUF6517 family protein n=1 Tax=Halospeciosus flavus TaxID=3032283 RepID=A0ABD5Z8J6_9EURY|nr:DUF6517 family protein [Halospeciosus flavus]